MSTPNKSDDDVLIPAAAWEISHHVGRYVSDQAIRKAARRIRALRLDAQGRGTLPRSVVEMMKHNIASLGYFVRRGQRSVEQAR
jgi:hypothetical protein